MSNVITINGTEYNEDDFTLDQKQLIAHVQVLQRKQADLRFQFTETEVALQAFSSALSASLAEEAEKEENNDQADQAVNE